MPPWLFLTIEALVLLVIIVVVKRMVMRWTINGKCWLYGLDPKSEWNRRFVIDEMNGPDDYKEPK